MSNGRIFDQLIWRMPHLQFDGRTVFERRLKPNAVKLTNIIPVLSDHNHAFSALDFEYVGGT